MDPPVTPEDASPDRRRLNRAVPWSGAGGSYSTTDAMHSVRKVASHRWERGTRQPYHDDGEYDYHGRYSRLRDVQSQVEAEEAERPRSKALRTSAGFHDRRGL